MSQFSTKIPIDVEAVKRMLPAKSDVQDVTLGQEADGSFFVVLEWSNDWMRTPFTFAYEWPLDQLRAKEIPAKVTNLLPPKALPKEVSGRTPRTK